MGQKRRSPRLHNFPQRVYAIVIRGVAIAGGASLSNVGAGWRAYGPTAPRTCRGATGSESSRAIPRPRLELRLLPARTIWGRPSGEQTGGARLFSGSDGKERNEQKQGKSTPSARVHLPGAQPEPPMQKSGRLSSVKIWSHSTPNPALGVSGRRAGEPTINLAAGAEVPRGTFFV